MCQILSDNFQNKGGEDIGQRETTMRGVSEQNKEEWSEAYKNKDRNDKWAAYESRDNMHNRDRGPDSDSNGWGRRKRPSQDKEHTREPRSNSETTFRKETRRESGGTKRFQETKKHRGTRGVRKERRKRRRRTGADMKGETQRTETTNETTKRIKASHLLKTARRKLTAAIFWLELYHKYERQGTVSGRKWTKYEQNASGW